MSRKRKAVAWTAAVSGILVIVAVGLSLLDPISKKLSLRNRIHNTMERLQWSGGTEEDQRRRRLNLDAVEKSSIWSISTPRIVVITAFRGAQQSLLKVSWICESPMADGIQLLSRGGEAICLNFNPGDLEINAENSSELVLFGAAIDFSRVPDSESWLKKLEEEEFKGILTRNGKPISNEAKVDFVDYRNRT